MHPNRLQCVFNGPVLISSTELQFHSKQRERETGGSCDHMSQAPGHLVQRACHWINEEKEDGWWCNLKHHLATSCIWNICYICRNRTVLSHPQNTPCTFLLQICGQLSGKRNRFVHQTTEHMHSIFTIASWLIQKVLWLMVCDGCWWTLHVQHHNTSPVLDPRLSTSLLSHIRKK